MAIREPVRLTAGGSSELMGVLGHDEQALYFVSNANATLDLMTQSPVESGPREVSSGLGDVAWPQVSPDGSHIAYISFERDSTGDVCVRSLSKGKVGDEKCLTGPDSAELQVLWWDDESLAVLSRRDLHADYKLQKIPLAGGTAKTLLARNMVGLTLSPDRKWLAYIPVEKRASGVGVTFSNRTAEGIRLHRLDKQGKRGKPVVYSPPLPGVTGYLAFSKDGKHLYFSQYLNDTNRDGAIDGDDNGVIFRLRFNRKNKKPLRLNQEPEQLTSARWDCHYPTPAKNQLIASCSHDGSLDVYSLPLGGAVPSEWDDARLIGEVAVARDLWSKLLLSSRRLVISKGNAAKAPIVRKMMSLHLELREYESAIYYAERGPKARETESLRWSEAIADLAKHRRADLALIRGQLSEQYIKTETARANSLRQRGATAPAEVSDLARLVISEIEDDVGKKSESFATFKEVKLEHFSDPLLARLAAQRARRLFRLRGDRDGLLAVYVTLSSRDALPTADRLRYAQRFVEELGRGRNANERKAAIKAWRAKTDDASDLALLLDVEKALLELDDETQEDVRKVLFALYKKNKDLDRRRALVLSTLQASAKLGNEYLQYQFATSWASWLKRAHPERKYAETIYRNIVLDRAYGEGAQGAIGESRGYFYGTTISSESLEGHIGFIEARIAEGKGTKVASLDEVYAKRFEREPESPIYAFVRAYRIARELPGQKNLDLHEKGIDETIELLETVSKAKPKESQVHQLWGFVLHLRARRTGSREAAVDANRQYLIALDLARDDKRLTASLLHRLGLLQASLGNHRLALRYFLKRDRLPHMRPEAELGLRVATARSAWHSDEPLIAKAQMQLAKKMLDARKSLAKYEPLVLDWLALSLSAAGDAAEARARYNELAELQKESKTSPINRLKTRIGLAVTSIESGDAKQAIEALSEADEVLRTNKALGSEVDDDQEVTWNESLTSNYRYSKLQYEALVSGLLVRANDASGDDSATRDSLKKRIGLLGGRLKQSRADEDRIALAQAYHQLAEVNYRLKDLGGTREALESGLRLSSEFNKNTGSGVNDAGLALLQAYAELHLYGGAKLSDYSIDLRAEISRAYSFVCKYRSPRWAKQRFLFELYLAMLSL